MGATIEVDEREREAKNVQGGREREREREKENDCRILDCVNSIAAKGEVLSSRQRPDSSAQTNRYSQGH